MNDQTPAAPGGSPTSWRDVYSLVQDSERRLTQTITAGFSRTSEVTADHEVRLRVMESDAQHVATTLVEQTKAGEVLIADFQRWRAEITKDVEDIQQSDLVKEARRGGILAVGMKAKAAILITIGLIGPAVTTIFLRIVLPPT